MQTYTRETWETDYHYQITMKTMNADSRMKVEEVKDTDKNNGKVISSTLKTFKPSLVLVMEPVLKMEMGITINIKTANILY